MNFSFQFLCSTQKKMYQEVVFGGIFLTFCTAGSLELPGSMLPGPTGGLQHPHDPLLLQAMTYGHCISCLRQDTTFIYALKTNLAHHSKFLLKKPVHIRYLSIPLLFSLTMLFLELACTGETSENCELHVSAVCLSLEKTRKSFT